MSLRNADMQRQEAACVQCDLWRPLRLPGILVGDGRLGGISTTIAAYDCLRMRGYDVPAIVLTDNGLQNWKYLEDHMSSETFVLSLPECPPAPESRSGPLHSDSFLGTCIQREYLLDAVPLVLQRHQEPACRAPHCLRTCAHHIINASHLAMYTMQAP